MSQLEQALVALGRELEFPPGPDLTAVVAARLGERGRRRTWWPAAAAVAAAFAVAFAVPPARSAILRFFHLGGVTIIRVETLPPAQERPLTLPLGDRVPIGRVYDYTGVHPLLPRGERPTHAYVFRSIVSFVLRAHGKPVLLTELLGDVVKKAVAEETRIEPVSVNGEPGYWIAGKRHVLEFLSTPPRLVGNVLVWRRGHLTLRLEGALSKGDAIALARGIR